MTDELEAPAPKTKPKSAPVGSLVDLYTVSGATPAKLLRELEKSTSWQFDPSDADAAVELIAKHDPHLQRTRQLLHEALETRDGRFGRTAGDFALRATAADLAGAAAWPPPDDVDPLFALETVCATLTSSLRDPKRARRAHNVLMIVVDLLSARHALAFETAVPALREALGAPSDYQRPRSNPRRHRIASVVDPRNDLVRVRDVLDLLQPLDDDLRAADRRAHDAAHARERAEDASRAASERVLALESRIEKLESEIAKSRQDAAVLSDQVRDARIIAGTDAAELRSRAIALLSTRLLDLLSTAKEASDLDPPRAQTASRLLEQAIKEIQQEVEWLRSSV